MTDQSQTQNKKPQFPHVAPADAASPFFTFQQLFRTEMGRVLDESTATFEKNAAEMERVSAEANRFGQAQVKAMYEANRAWVAGLRTMLG